MARFYLDEDVTPHLKRELADFGHDAETTIDRGLNNKRFPDWAQLLHATTSARIMVTHNEHDYRKLHKAWCTWRAHWVLAHPHSGIVILPQGDRASRYAQHLDGLVASGAQLQEHVYILELDSSWTTIGPPETP